MVALWLLQALRAAGNSSSSSSSNMVDITVGEISEVSVSLHIQAHCMLAAAAAPPPGAACWLSMPGVTGVWASNAWQRCVPVQAR